jgi:glutathione synthase/RimK-type ligase-like ATP-grasp enzyme
MADDPLRGSVSNQPLLCYLLLADKKLRTLTDLFEMHDHNVRFVGVSSFGVDDESLCDDAQRLVAAAAQGREVTGAYVLHKAAFDLLASQEDASAAARWHLLQQLPPSMLIDPIQSTVLFADRAALCRELQDLAPVVQQPCYAELSGCFEEVLEAISGLTFPLLCKPFAACGSAGHQLALVMSRAGMAELVAGSTSAERPGDACLLAPLVAQEFVNHGGVVFKVYAIGAHIHVATRPSLPDVGDSSTNSATVVYIDSQRMTPAKAPEDEVRAGCARSELLSDQEERDVERTINAVRARLGVELLGIDMIRSRDGQLLVIDVNHFSGSSSSVPQFGQALARTLRRKHGGGGVTS